MSSIPLAGKEDFAAEDPEPLPPVAPQPGDCCGEGCAHCVLDLYDAAIERYLTELTAWQARQHQH